jgi:hypothetical protein
MSHLSSFITWFVSDPRRLFVILFVILVALMLVSALVPGAPVLAGEATSGS